MDSQEDLRSMYAKLVENLNCPICHATLNDARDLSCGHTYCLSCLQELVTMNGWTSSIKCCLCQTQTDIPAGGLNSLKQNFKLNCIIDEQATIMKKLEEEQARQQMETTGATEAVQVFVRDLEGKSQVIQIRLSDTVNVLKQQVNRKIGIPPNVQRLIFCGKQLEGGMVLEECGVKALSTIELNIPLKGGDDQPHRFSM